MLSGNVYAYHEHDVCVYIFDVILYVIFYESCVNATRYVTIYIFGILIYRGRVIIYNII